MLPGKITKSAEAELSRHLNSVVKVVGFSLVGGGDINETGKLSTDHGDFFIKWNDALKYPKMFEKEHIGLDALRSTGAIEVPEVILQEEVDRTAFLLMEFIATGKSSKQMWTKFGHQLANMHMHTSDRFGLDTANYIGSLPQVNHWATDWISFFIEHRLSYQGELAYSKGLLSKEDMQLLEQLFKKLPGLIPEENPALLHGDLWSGNYLVDENNLPVLIDPAVYYGHREMDLSMMRLFGGFDEKMYEAYQDAFPLQPGWEMRIDIHNLYPLLVHVNLFGSSYVSTVRGILKKLQ